MGIFPLTGVVGDAEIRIGGIGGVATLPEFRGKGYMSNLMECSIQKMTEDKYSISILWGDRQRYANFGKGCNILEWRIKKSEVRKRLLHYTNRW